MRRSQSVRSVLRTSQLLGKFGHLGLEFLLSLDATRAAVGMVDEIGRNPR